MVIACEKNQNTCASSASISGGIPPQTNKVANFISRVTGVSAVVNKIREAKKRRAERKAAAQETVRQKRIEAARSKVELTEKARKTPVASALEYKSFFFSFSYLTHTVIIRIIAV